MINPLLEFPFDALVSYHYFQDEHQMGKVVSTGNLRLIGDSGAFSAFTQGTEIDVRVYTEWAQQWREHLYWVAALDVFGDPQGTWNNWKASRDLGLETVPTIHIGTDLEWLDRYANHGVDFLGLGGMVGIPADQQLRWLVHVFRYARDNHPGMRFHTWGMTNPNILAKLPIFSADSSGALGRAYRFGILQLWNSHTRKIVSIKLDGCEPYNHVALLKDQYGTTPQEVERSTPANRELLVRIGAAAVQRQAKRYQRLHKVPPPTWGINQAWNVPNGPRVHAAETTARDLNAVLGPRVHVVDTGYRNHLHMLGSEGETDE